MGRSHWHPAYLYVVGHGSRSRLGPDLVMPTASACLVDQQRGHPAGSGKMSSPQKGAKKVQSKSGRSQESDEEEPYIPWRKAIKKVA